MLVRPATLSVIRKGQPYTGLLTTSGDLINDAFRNLGVEGDGATTPTRRTGIYGAYTNLVTNGGFETDTTGWADVNSATGTRVTTTSHFGSASLQVVTDGAGANEGTRYGISGSNRIAAVTGETWTWNPSLKGTDSEGISLFINEYSAASGGFLRSNQSALGALTTDFARYSMTVTLGASTTHIDCQVLVSATGATTFFVDGALAVQSPIALPYVETDGGTAAATACNVTIPTTGLSGAAGAVLANVTPRWDNTNEAPGNTFWFDWRVDGPNRITLSYEVSANQFTLVRRSGGSGTNAAYPQAITNGTSLAIHGKWDGSGNHYVAAAGGAWATNTGVAPDLSGVAAGYIGSHSDGAQLFIYSDVNWMAFYGPGGALLTDADNAYVESLGVNASWEDMPLKEHLVAFWDGVSDYYWSFV